MQLYLSYHKVAKQKKIDGKITFDVAYLEDLNHSENEIICCLKRKFLTFQNI